MILYDVLIMLCTEFGCQNLSDTGHQDICEEIGRVAPNIEVIGPTIARALLFSTFSVPSTITYDKIISRICCVCTIFARFIFAKLLTGMEIL